MADLTCDVAIVGAGTAGIAAERSARAAGASTLLIDKSFPGTTCASVGCMPSKLLIAAARAASAVREADKFGIVVRNSAIDGPAVMARVRRLRDSFVQAAKKSYDELPRGVAVKAQAKLLSGTQLALDDGRAVVAKAIVLATGSHPLIPKQLSALNELVLTNETIFDLQDLPATLAVIGAGPLGLELASAFARLGVDTEVFDEGKHIGGLRDDGLSERFRSLLSKDMPIHLGVDLRSERDGDAVQLKWTGPTYGTRRFSRLLVATGRPPNLQDLDLKAAGLDVDDKGIPLFDPSTMQCGVSRIFMAGDVNASRPVLHEAIFDGEIAGRNAASWPKTSPSKRTPAMAITFTDPALALIGRVDGPGLVLGEVDYADQGRAIIEGLNEGFARIFADRDGGLTGAVLASPGAEHLAHLLAWAIAEGATVDTLSNRPFYHPTLEEGLKTALLDFNRRLSSTS